MSFLLEIASHKYLSEPITTVAHWYLLFLLGQVWWRLQSWRVCHRFHVGVFTSNTYVLKCIEEVPVSLVDPCSFVAFGCSWLVTANVNQVSLGWDELCKRNRRAWTNIHLRYGEAEFDTLCGVVIVV